MGGSSTVVERRVGVIDNLSERKALVLFARCEQMVRRLVAKLNLRGLGHCVVVGTPHEHDRIANGCVEGEWDIAENTLSGSNYDGVGCARSRASATSRSRRGGRQRHRSGRAELGNTLLNTAIISAVIPARRARAVSR